MKKIIKRWGGSIILRFSPEETKIFKLKVGDTIELNDKDFERHVEEINKKQKENNNDKNL